MLIFPFQKIPAVSEIQISKMFKQARKNVQGSKDQQSPSQQGPLSRTQKIANTLPKQILQFLVRQFAVLKDIASSCHQIHPDIIANRLQQCTHLMEKKVSFSLGENPEQYHDYIQDFYENQINDLRMQLNTCKMDSLSKKKQLQELKTAFEILQREKQTFLHTLESSRVSKNNIEQSEQNSILKKQLDHCRLLLIENNTFIEEQAKAIEALSAQLRSKQKQQQAIREKYDRKISQFDNTITNHNSQMEEVLKNLSIEHKNYQSQLKEISFVKLRVNEEKVSLEKELEMKIEEIQLLTKKILEDEIVISKLERTTALKDKLIEELYQEIDSVNGNLSRIGKKEEVFHKTYVEKNQEIEKLEERIRMANEANEKMEKKNSALSKKVQDLNKQIKQISGQFHQSEKIIGKMEAEKDSLIRKLDISEKNQAKIMKQRDRMAEQLKNLEERYQELYHRNRQEKQAVKKEILTQVNELIAIVHQKQGQLKQTITEKEELSKELIQEKQVRQDVQYRFDKMNTFTTEIQNKLEILQNENCLMNEAKCLLECQVEKLGQYVQKMKSMELEYLQLRTEKQNLTNWVSQVRQKQAQILNSHKNVNEELEKKQQELERQYGTEIKQYKEAINRKQFQNKQLQSKVKILQEEVRESSKLFENEKMKMSQKIKQLEELLKERYDFSSRFSQNSEPPFF